jgi:hypothetical protein
MLVKNVIKRFFFSLLFVYKSNFKVDALRGAKFCKLPRILGITLNRFMFDYMTMKRNKLDDFVSFPFILNFNNYIKYNKN